MTIKRSLLALMLLALLAIPCGAWFTGGGQLTGFYAGGASGAEDLLQAEDGLALDFTDMSAKVKDTATPANDFFGDPNSLLTYTSPSTKWVRDANGVYQSGTTLRTDHATDGTPLGLLVEEARTNVMLRSQEFDNASWTKSSATGSADTDTSPDGTADADTVAATGSNGYISQNYTQGNNAAGYGSIFLKRKTGSGTVTVEFGPTVTTPTLNSSYQRVEVAGASTAATYSVTSNVVTVSMTGHNMQTGDAIRADYTSGGAGDSSIASITRVDADTFTYSQTTGNTSGNVTVYPRTFRVKLATNGDEVYAWQAQVESTTTSLTYASSPIVTTSGTVTRADDQITLASSAFPSYSPTGSMVIWGQIIKKNTNQNTAIVDIELDTSNGTDFIFLGIGSDVSPYDQRVYIESGGASQASIVTVGSNDWPEGSFVKGAMAWNTNDIRQAANGTLLGSDASATIPSGAATLKFNRGKDNSSTLMLGLLYVKQFTFVSRRMADDELVSRTR